MTLNRIAAGVALCGWVALAGPARSSPVQPTVIQTFTLNTANGAYPAGPLIADSSGALYGITSDGGSKNQGSVYKLVPGLAGHPSTLTTLYSFLGGTDGYNPGYSLTRDASGALYGVTVYGGIPCSVSYPCGNVFKLTPPASGETAWTKTTIASFGSYYYGYDYPSSALLLGPDGTLYGTTLPNGAGDYGTVYALKPPASGKGAWTVDMLHAFSENSQQASSEGWYPSGLLIMSPSGALYGTASGGGVFTGICGDYSGCGTVFELTPPPAGQTAWTNTVLYRFTGGLDGFTPSAGVIAGPAGTLYSIATQGGGTKAIYGGTVIALTPPASGSGSWSEQTLHAFSGVPDGEYPRAALVADSQGGLLGTTTFGGAALCRGDQLGCGTAFALSPPASGKGAWFERALLPAQPSTGVSPSGLLLAAGPVAYETNNSGGPATDSAGTIIQIQK